jgi:CDP-paratose 2-epimerase
MNVCLISGSSGLVGSEAVKYFKDRFDLVIGIDNDGRQEFFDTQVTAPKYENYNHWVIDITNTWTLEFLFKDHGKEIKLVINCAAQPSHDLAAKIPLRDFAVNAAGTLHMLEHTRNHCPEAVFIQVSTNKVYGDRPNEIPMYSGPHSTRFEVPVAYEDGFDETIGIDQTTHSLFGVSKSYGDLVAQEYGRYFGMKVGIFRPGCITGGNHKGAKLHGFLSYLVKCAKHDIPYEVIGYRGLQVRDQIHAYDLVTMFDQFRETPKPGEVYNAGGGTHSNCSVLEAISMCEQLTGRKMQITFNDTPRIGDHKWYISDIYKFRKHYPNWKYTYTLEQIIKEIYDAV